MKIRIVTIMLIMGLVSSSQTFVDGQIDRREKKVSRSAFIFGEFGETSVRGLAGERDLGKYAQGGHFDFRTYRLGRPSGNNNIFELAEFLSNQLENKRLGYARASYNSPDAGATIHFFVEPDKDGTWGILCRLVGWHALPGGNRRLDYPKAYGVTKVIHDSKVVGFHLLDRSGKAIDHLEFREN